MSNLLDQTTTAGIVNTQGQKQIDVGAQIGKRFASGLAEPLISAGLILIGNYLFEVRDKSLIKIPFVNFEIREQYVDALASAATIGATNLLNKNIMPLIFTKMQTDPYVYDAVQSLGPYVSFVSGGAVAYLMNYVDNNYAQIPKIPDAFVWTRMGIKAMTFSGAHLLSKNINDSAFGAVSLLIDSLKK